MLSNKDYKRAQREGLALRQIHQVARQALRDGLTFNQALRRFQQRQNNYQLQQEARLRIWYERPREAWDQMLQKLEDARIPRKYWPRAPKRSRWGKHPGPPPSLRKRKIRRYY